MDFNQLLLAAFLVESIVQTLKPIYDKKKGWSVDGLFALAVSMIVCILVRIDLFSKVGLPITIPNTSIGTYIGAALTGIIASRGSNLAHDLLKYIENASHPTRGSAVG